MLLWMGYGLVLHVWRGEDRGSSTKSDRAQMNDAFPSPLAGQLAPIPAGMVASIANPYWFLWWATVGASYVFLALEQGVLGLAAFYSGHILSDLSWNSLLALAGTTLSKRRLYVALFLLCGLFLLGLGGYFLWTSVRFWAGLA